MKEGYWREFAMVRAPMVSNGRAIVGKLELPHSPVPSGSIYGLLLKR